MKVIASVDIGGTKTIVALTNEEGKILRKEIFLTITEDYEETFCQCCKYIVQFLQEISKTVEDLYGVGINIPGMYDAKKQILIKAPFAAWENVKVNEYFRNKLGIDEIFVENDVKNCALGEKYFGYGKKYKDYVWITVSTGIGGALVQDGRLIRGNNNLAGEIGHIKVEYKNAKKCCCGEAGCLEAYASGTAITRTVREAAEEDSQFKEEFLQRGLPVDAQGCAELARLGISKAVEIYEREGDYLARGIAAVVNLMNPQVVILGGGVSKSIDLFLPEVKKRIKEYVIEKLADTEIISTNLGYEAALLGTTALVLDRKENLM